MANPYLVRVDEDVFERLFEYYRPALVERYRIPVSGAQLDLPEGRKQRMAMLNYHLFDPHFTMVWTEIMTYAHLTIWLPYLNRSKYRFSIVCPSMKGKKRAEVGLERTPFFPLNEGFNSMSFPLVGDSLASFFFIKNTRKNFPLFEKYPGHMITHIHHGDSDKFGSSTMMATKFDYLIVADRNAINRFLSAGVPVDESKFLPVGGPVIPGVEYRPDGSSFKNILYAPTFEGANDKANFSSLVRAGNEINAFAKDVGGKQFVFRGHHSIGTRLEEYKQASADLAPYSQKEWTKAEQFNWADILIADISGVTSEFLFTGKPVIIPAAEHDEKIITQLSSSGAVKFLYLWDYTKTSLKEMIESIANGDPLRQERLARRESLYGLSQSIEDAVEVFDRQLTTIIEAQNVKKRSLLGFRDLSPVPLPADKELAAVVKKVKKGRLIRIKAPAVEASADESTDA